MATHTDFYLRAGEERVLDGHAGRRLLMICPHASDVQFGIGSDPGGRLGIILPKGQTASFDGAPPTDPFFLRALDHTTVTIIED